MNYDELLAKREKYQQMKDQIPADTLESLNRAFDIEYAHDSTAIEGNTLSLAETKIVLERCAAGQDIESIAEMIAEMRKQQIK